MRGNGDFLEISKSTSLWGWGWAKAWGHEKIACWIAKSTTAKLTILKRLPRGKGMVLDVVRSCRFFFVFDKASGTGIARLRVVRLAPPALSEP